MKLHRVITTLGICAVGLWMLAAQNAVQAGNGNETCASRYPDAPTILPRGYEHKSEADAYMAFRREARKLGFVSIKKTTRDSVDHGPCEGYGIHLNLKGNKGKGGKWYPVGSLTSCKICEDTPQGPRLRSPAWRIHPKF